MKHCKGCSHPTICNTMGCGAEEARANKAKAAEPSYAELKAQRDELLDFARIVLHGLEQGHINAVRKQWNANLPDVWSLKDAARAAIAKAEGKEGGAA